MSEASAESQNPEPETRVINLPDRNAPVTVAEIADRIDARIASRLIRDSNVFLTIEAGDYALYTRRQLTAGTQAGN